MKRAIICFVVSISCFLLSGCWDRTELNDLALVTGIGIDQKGKEIELTAQLVVPKKLGAGASMGGNNSGSSGGATIVRSGTGKTLADAIAHLQEKLPRRLFWGHVKVIVFGEKAAKAGIRAHMDFLSRNPQTRLRSNVLVSDKTAKSVLELLPPIEQSSAEVLRELSNSQILMNITLKDVLQMLSGETGAAALPMVTLLPIEKEKTPLETIAYIDRTAIFKGDRMIGSIGDKLTRGALWIRNEIEQANITVSLKGAEGKITSTIIRANTKLIPSYKNGRWKMTIDITSRDDVLLNATNLSLYNEKHIHQLEKALAQATIERVNATLKKVQKEMHADIFGFADVIHRKYPKQWNRIKNRWDDIFPEIEVKVKANVVVQRPGMNTTPQGIPEDEVKK
ncbi:spore germination protein KC [Anoxybacillus voinovskiensis]|uniref:Spore germination protein KC n=1 Tax=Anoxybacteroides voinovskiense TaxID=230470 RepID=A0A840DMZ5_9BACL|nr:Ger(x)C family spore germination protein [Anoxybacillus voinovskiensis]MBB4073005.1 spore germination protein KC [Anoxybacillus voinovskiensis]GGJ60179.1 germination protein [Anoxybacillus voinovskiensis]